MRRKCFAARKSKSSKRRSQQEAATKMKTIQQKHSSQMFVAKPSQAILTFGVMISLLMITTTMIANDNQQVEANLIGIYHRYRPLITKNHLLNTSSSSLFPQLSDSQQKGFKNPVSRSNEYNSPIKRIIELISQHAPVIVVSSGNSDNNNNDRHPHPLPAPPPPPPPPPPQAHQMHYGLPQQHLQSASNQLGPTFQSSSPALIASSAGSSDRQHWTVMETGPMGLQSLGDNQPQIIATSMPSFDQYQHMIDDNGNQIALQVQQSQPLAFGQSLADGQHFQHMASGFPPDNSQQSPLFVQNQDQYQYQLQQNQQHQQQPQQLQTQEAQPIFLSSYVPEIQLANRGPAPNASPTGAQAGAPDSIQDNIQANVAEEQAGKPEAQDSEGPGSGDEGDSEASAGPPPGRGALDESGENDIEEPQPQNNHQVEESEDPNSSDSGSITYEDKYDSDKDEPRAHSSSPASAGDSDSSPGDGDSTRSEASGNIVNGLIKVGLTDDCLQCICRAASGCDHQLRCVTRGSDEKYCGPFQLTEEYWNMAGSPGDASTNFSSFEDCANDIDCAVETVTKYMKKYYRDCDGDKYYTCTDYARLHRLKPDECGNTGKLVNGFDAYWAKFELCAEGYNRSRTGDDEEI